MALLLSEGTSVMCCGCFVCKHSRLVPVALDESCGDCLLVSGAVLLTLCVKVGYVYGFVVIMECNDGKRVG